MIHQVGPTRVFAASVCTQVLTKLVNALCLDWDQTGWLKMLIGVFALITSMLVGMYHVAKIGCDIRNCFYFPAHFNE